MGKKFTTDDIREAADAEYGSTDIELKNGEVVSLLNPLRLDKAKRKRLMSIQDELSEEGEEDVDQEEFLTDAIRLVADSRRKADALIEEADGDLAFLAQVFKFYTEGAQVGEASASQD